MFIEWGGIVSVIWNSVVPVHRLIKCCVCMVNCFAVKFFVMLQSVGVASIDIVERMF